MRYMIMLKMRDDVGPPTNELMEAMGSQMEELFKSGVMVDAGALLPSSATTRIRLTDGKVSVTDGPFTEATELVGGYSIVEVGSRDEALQLGRRLIEMHQQHWPGWEGEAEVRQFTEQPPMPAS